MARPNLKKLHVLLPDTKLSRFLWLSFGLVSLVSIVILFILEASVHAIIGSGLVAFVLLTALFFYGLPTKIIASVIFICGLTVYVFLDPTIWGSKDPVLKIIHKFGLAYGAIFGGALLGAVCGKGIILTCKRKLVDCHMKLRVRSGVCLAMGLLMLVFELEVSKVVLQPTLHAFGEFFIAAGIGLLIESRGRVYELLHHPSK